MLVRTQLEHVDTLLILMAKKSPNFRKVFDILIQILYAALQVGLLAILKH